MLPSTTAPPLAPNFLADLLADLLQHRLLRGAGDDAVDMAADRADEGDAHHAGFEFRRRRVRLGDLEAVDDEELDLLVADGLARRRRQLLPDFERRSCDCRMKVPPSTSPRSGLEWLNTLWSGETTISTSSSSALVMHHRLGAERDVVVGRRAALLRAVFRRRLRVQVEHAGQDVGQQLAGRHGAVAADRMEADAERAFRQQVRVRLGLQRHQLGFGIGRLQLRPAARPCAATGSSRRTASRDRRTARCRLLHVLERGDQVARLQVVRAEAEDRGGDLAAAARSPGCRHGARRRRSRAP